VLGLGEAGSALALDLVEAGCAVRGFDPAERRPAARLLRVASQLEAVVDADVVLSVNLAEVALAVAEEVMPALSPAQLYAELNTASPAVKVRVEQALQPSGVLYADVALLGAVPGNGLRTPALVSGPGAKRFAELFASLGMPVDVVSDRAGDAAARKLVRSVFMKGLAASMVESLEAAQACGIEAWLRGQILRELDRPSAELVDRLVSGTALHAARRMEEMAAAAELLASLGVEPRVALAAEGWLEEIATRRTLEAGARAWPRSAG